MAELSAVPFNELPSSHDGYTLLYDNEVVHQSDAKLSELVQSAVDETVKDKLDTTAFSTVSGNFLTAVDLSDYYTKSETSGKNELTDAFNTKQDKLTFAGENDTITAINNSAVGGGSDSWKQLSEEHGSSGTLTGDEFSVYVGQSNSGFNDSFTFGRDNYSKQGVNIGYDNKIEVDTEEILPGNVNIGKWNLVDGAGGINIGQSNSAHDFGVNIGETSTASSGGYNLGSTNSAFVNSVSIGQGNYAINVSQSIGFYNEASYNSFGIGYGNKAVYCGYTYGEGNSANSIGIAIGQRCTAKNGSVAIGLASNVTVGSFGIGKAITASGGSLAMGETLRVQDGAIAYGVDTTATNGSVSVGNKNMSISGSLVIGNNNNAFKGNQVFGIGNTAYTGSTIVGFNNYACFATVVGNDNNINMAGSSNPETYTKPAIPFVRPPEDIQIKSFVAGLGNTAYYAKNTYILGHYNTITPDYNEYVNTENDGFTLIYGMRNSAARNWDMAIGYKSFASGGENIAIGVPFQSIVGYYSEGEYLQPATANINPVAHGYKNFVLRGNVSGTSNTAINSNLTGNYITDSDLGNVVNNSLINSFVQANTIKEVNYDGDHYVTAGYLLNNTFKNSTVLLTGVNVNYNKFTNDNNIIVVGDNGFNFNNFWHNTKVELSGNNINKNIFFNNERMHIESPDICRNFIMDTLPYGSTEKNSFTATKLFTDNFMVKTIIATGNNTTLSSVNENFMFNTRIDPSNVTAYRGWSTNSNIDTTLTRNFLVGSYVGKYVYGTVSFADNSDRNTGEMGKISNTIRIFNFGDNTINKAENSLVFGAKNGISAIANSFVFGSSNTVENTHLHDNEADYLNNIFVFGDDNKLINDKDEEYSSIVVRNKILGIRNYVKAADRINDNTIIGNDNSINYNVTVPTKSTVISNVIYPTNPTTAKSLQSAAFATYRNYILGNCNRVSQCITDSLIVGEGNYVFDTTIKAATDTADYNSLHVLGVANIAYDGSNQLNIGYNNETSGHFAEAIGDGIIARGQQLIVGTCNAIVDDTNRYSVGYDESTSSVYTIEPSGVIFAIGNGTYDYTFAQYTNEWGWTETGYFDKNKNLIPTADINNEEYITRSNAFTVSANGVVSASDYCTSAGDKLSELTELVAVLRSKPTTGTYVLKCVDGALSWVAE